ncbi:DNA polymerase kappa, partial [Geodia barretti]
MEDDGRESPDLFEDEEESPANHSGSEQEDETCVSLNKSTAAATAREISRSKSFQSAPLSRIGLNDNKAGMEGLDRDKINQIILEATKGSKYYENELRKERERAGALKATDKELEALEATRDYNHIIVHVDMDAFYAAVEMRDDPRLKDVPMAVGGSSMLSTSNYLARRYGVRAAMPGFIARKLCPNIVIVPLHLEKYRQASEQISGIGKVTESMLNALSVTTWRDLYQQRAVLQLLFSQSSSSHFLRVCLGLGSTHVHRTFAEISEPSQLQQKCLELCRELAGDMERDAIMGRTVGVMLKTVSFEVKTKTVTLPQPVSLAEQLHSAASGLLETEIRACAPNPLRLRLMGVRISSLQSREQSEQRGGSSGEGRGKQETLDVFVQQQP